MNKRNRLKVSTPESTFNLSRDDSMVLNPSISRTSSFKICGADLNDETGIECRTWSCSGVLRSIGSYSLYVLFFAMAIYVLLKPSEHSILLEEICRLRQENSSLRNAARLENICMVDKGTQIEIQTPLYRYGLLRSRVSDPNSAMEPGRECLSFKGSRGSFVASFATPVRLKKIGIYHPKLANAASGIKDFSVSCGDASHAFTFRGVGYEEFVLEGQETSSITVCIESNHGEERYTSLYRFYVYV